MHTLDAFLIKRNKTSLFIRKVTRKIVSLPYFGEKNSTHLLVSLKMLYFTFKLIHTQKITLITITKITMQIEIVKTTTPETAIATTMSMSMKSEIGVVVTNKKVIHKIN